MSKQQHITIEQLRLFKLIHEHGSMSHAAAILDTAQPSISRQIKNLEGFLGVRLFHRTGRGVTLSMAGERLLEHANTILSAVTEAEIEVRELTRGITGEVHLGVTPMVSQVMTGPLVSDVARRYPDVIVRIHEGPSDAVTEWVTDGDIDLAVMYKPPSQFREAIDSSVLLKEPLCLIEASHQDHSPIEFGDISRKPLILPSPVNGMRRSIDAISKERGVSLNIVQEFDSYAATMSMTRCGAAATILPMMSILDEINAGFFSARPIISPSIAAYLSLYVGRSSPKRRSVRAVINRIHTLVQKHPMPLPS